MGACEAAGLRAAGGPGRGIVYCSTRKKTELVATAMREAGFPVAYYHAGRSAEDRARVQAAYERGRLRVLVATSAFGMGVDYPDVRVIVHFQAPGSVAAYYQEAGRAGRDGQPALCLLLFGLSDLVTQRRLQAGDQASPAQRSRVNAALAAVERYASAARCRQQLLCQHFTGVAGQAPCGLCDVCAGEHEIPPPAASAAARARAPRAVRAHRGGRLEDPGSRELARELADYRGRAARELEWKAYMVLHDSVLHAIAAARPITLDALAEIPGIGPSKLARFGEAILEVIRRHGERG
jgi:ATP-dependent DNA helicase RecQ